MLGESWDRWDDAWWVTGVYLALCQPHLTLLLTIMIWRQCTEVYWYKSKQVLTEFRLVQESRWRKVSSTNHACRTIQSLARQVGRPLLTSLKQEQTIQNTVINIESTIFIIFQKHKTLKATAQWLKKQLIFWICSCLQSNWKIISNV